MIRLICIYAALFIAGIYTINAYWIGMNDQTTIAMFDRYPILFAPASYVYLIWLVIIMLFLIYLITFRTGYSTLLFQNNLQAALLVCSAAVHILVLYIWHENQYMSSIILNGAMLILLFSLYITYPLNKKFIKYRTPISLLFSWELFVFLLMMNFTLVRYEWSGLGLSFSLWTVIFLTFGTATVMHLKYHYHDKFPAIIFTWSYLGIAVANGFNELLVTTAALFLSGVMIASIYLLKKNREAN